VGENAHIFPIPNNHLLSAQSADVIIVLGSESRALELRAGDHTPLLVVVGKSDFLLLAYDFPNGDLTLSSLSASLANSYIFLFLRNSQMRDFLSFLTSY